MKTVIIVLCVLVIAVVLFFLGIFKKDTLNPYDVASCDYSVPDSEIPKFSSVPCSFIHKFDGKKLHPLVGSTMIDIDNDGVDELFIGSGIDQDNSLFRFQNGELIDISSETGVDKIERGGTIGAVSFDLDNNGHVDLILTREDGVWFLSNDGKKFTASKLDITTDDKSAPATLTLGDYDSDGLIDIFLCTYIRLEFMEGQTIFNQQDYGSNSILLRNRGELVFEDVTEAAGLTYTHNTFQGTFVDLNDDGPLDLVVAYDTGEARIYGNNGDGTFAVKETPMTGRFGYPMGLGLGDINNDGKPDLFFSNTGSTVPEFIGRGDLRDDQEFNKDWMLWRNDGDFKFTDVAEKRKVANFEFSWGGLLHDFNLDGRQDLAVAESYVAFPPHGLFALPCRFLVQREDGTFAAVEDQSKVINKHFAISPLTTDWNQDGYPDLVWINLKGPAKAFLNEGGNANSVTVVIPENGINPGAKITVKTSTGKTLTDWYVIGEGLASDQSNAISFGLGKDSVVSITVKFPDGTTREVASPQNGGRYIVSRK